MSLMEMVLCALLLCQAVVIFLIYRLRAGRSDPAVNLMLAELKGQLSQLVDAQHQSRSDIRHEVEISREAQGKRLSEIKQEVDLKLSEMVTRHTQSAQQLSENAQRSSEHLSQRLVEMRNQLSETLRTELNQLRSENEAKLEKMRETVDEKLHTTLETRLATSFQIVSDRLDAVTSGLNDMQVLAAGVGDLKKVLSNVKTRGNLGEFQLGALLEQVLSPEQYTRNQIIDPTTNDRVDFAIKLPGQSHDAPVWLPIDAKFPTEDYQRLLDAYDSTDSETIDRCLKSFERTFKEQAESIANKYVKPPHSTDFGIMFLPTEGLYAEALRRPGLVEQLQNSYRISIAGPTTIAALLNSLQMGFRTLSVQKRTSEVQRALAAFKTEFDKFSTSLDKAQKKIIEAGNSLSATQQRRRAVSKTLKNIESLDGPAINLIDEFESDDAEISLHESPGDESPT